MARIVWTEAARADVAPRDASSLEDVDVGVVWQKTRKSFSAVRDAFEKGGDYTKASGELKKSQDAYDAAYKAMVTKLSDQPAYAAAVGEQTKAESDLAAARAASADRAESAALAAQAMDARKVVHKLEADAADKDQAVKDAKAKIAASKSAVDALKKTFEETLKADPEYAAAKQAVDAARPAKV